MKALTALSICTGAGGLDMGLERAGIHAIAHVEREKAPQRILRTRWPQTPVLPDLVTIPDHWPVDIIHGGPPCQDNSHANAAGKGVRGSRSGLVFRMLDIVAASRPKAVLIENVAGLISRGLEDVVERLHAIGYRVEVTRVWASDGGLPHRRERVLIIGYRADLVGEDAVGGSDTFGGEWTAVDGLAVAAVKHSQASRKKGQPRTKAMRLSIARWRPAKTDPAALWSTLVGSETGRTKLYAQGGSSLSLQVRDWPTLTHKGNHASAKRGTEERDGLATAVTAEWATLRASDDRSPGVSQARADATNGTPLGHQVRDWPTLVASDFKAASSPGQRRGQLGEAVNDAAGWDGVGPLNPVWCEALMGWPMGWTDPTVTNSELVALPGPVAGRGPDQYEWEPRRMVKPRSVKGRPARIKMGGNGCVGWIGVVAGRRIREVLGRGEA